MCPASSWHLIRSVGSKSFKEKSVIALVARVSSKSYFVVPQLSMGIKYASTLLGCPTRAKRTLEEANAGHPRPTSVAKLGNWSQVVKGKIIGVDVSVLFHGLFPAKTLARQMLMVNATTSVFYLVAQRMNQWFAARGLQDAKGVIFVHDPKLVNQFHCDTCRRYFDNEISIKNTLSGRKTKRDQRRAQELKWAERVREFQRITDPEERRIVENKLLAAFRIFANGASDIKQGLHAAFVAWVQVYNQDVANARALVEKRSTRGTRKRNGGRAHKASWPYIRCVNSPVEADDQLGCLYRSGLVDVILTVDSDLIAIGCFHMVNRGILGVSVNKKSTVYGFTQQSVLAHAPTLFGIGRAQWQRVDDKYNCVRCLWCLLSCVAGNDYVVGGLPASKARATIQDLVMRNGPVLTASAVADVAKGVWQKNVVNRRCTKLQQTYNSEQKYIGAFCHAYEVYNIGRSWQFASEAPSWEQFLKGEFEAVGSALLPCGGGWVDLDSTYFVKTDVSIEPRMMLDIPFDDFPPESLPSEMLEWWLLCRGCETHASCSRESILMNMAHMRKYGRVKSKEDYRTTYSTVLHALLGTSPRVPVLKWCSSPLLWKISPSITEKQDITFVKNNLSRCILDSESQPFAKKERKKANEMNHDGQVYWKDFTVKQGMCVIGDATMEVCSVLLRVYTVHESHEI